MAIEAIGGAGMAYQGSASTTVIRGETQPKVEVTENAATADRIAADTVTISTKKSAGENSGESRSDNPNSSMAQQNQQAAQNAKIKAAVDEINRRSAQQSEAIFGIHEKTNRVTIKIVDKKSKEVIKEYPPEKTLDMIAKVWEMAGLLVDEKR